MERCPPDLTGREEWKDGRVERWNRGDRGNKRYRENIPGQLRIILKNLIFWLQVLFIMENNKTVIN